MRIFTRKWLSTMASTHGLQGGARGGTRAATSLLVLSTVALGSFALPSCGGEDITCGSGTRKKGSECVPSGASGGSGGTGTTANTAPSFEGTRSLSPAGETALQVTWNAATDDSTAADALVYNIYVSNSAGAQNFGVPSVVSPPGAQSVLVGGLTPGSEYFVVVRAQDAEGAEDTNTTEKSGTPEADSEAPTFAGITGTEAAGATAVKVSWSPATDDKTAPEGITYTVRWSTSEGGASTGRVGAVSFPGAESVVVTGLPASESEFFFNVRASDAAGNTELNSTELAGSTGVDTTPPVFGGCTGVGAPGATKATLSWQPAKDDVESPDSMIYNVYAFTEPPDEETPFGAPQGTVVGGTQGEVQGLSNATEYYFVCRAADKAGNEDANISFRTVTTLTDGSPPSFGGITGITEGATSAELTWDPGADDQTAEGKLVYLVYQGTIPGTALMNPPVAQSGEGSIAITLTGLESSTEYFWVVRAQDEAGNISENVMEVSVTTKVSFAKDIETAIFAQKCNKDGCHGTVNPQQGMSLAPGFAYFNIVNVSAVQIPSGMTEPMLRINTSSTNPRDSYLYRKIDPLLDAQGVPLPTDINGLRMPRDQLVPLLDEEQAAVALWIQQGAENN